MNYNIEDHEEELKGKVPYDLSDQQWQDIQQRIREKVIPGNAVPFQEKKNRNIRWWVAGSAAAVLILSFMIISPYKDKPQSGSHVTVAENAEQRLDKVINGLNDAELNWIHQLNENELSEQEQYIENQVQL